MQKEKKNLPKQSLLSKMVKNNNNKIIMETTFKNKKINEVYEYSIKISLNK